jgi:hypothetical protein
MARLGAGEALSIRLYHVRIKCGHGVSMLLTVYGESSDDAILAATRKLARLAIVLPGGARWTASAKQAKPQLKQ